MITTTTHSHHQLPTTPEQPSRIFAQWGLPHTVQRAVSVPAQEVQAELVNAAEQGGMLCTKRYRGRCEWLIKDDEMLWRFMIDDDIPLTNNEAERAQRGYVLWRKGSYGVCSHRGELFRQ